MTPPDVRRPDVPAPDVPVPDMPEFDRRMLEALVCPVTRGPLTYSADRQELVSRAAHLAFPIRNGIPIMLAGEARDVD